MKHLINHTCLLFLTVISISVFVQGKERQSKFLPFFAGVQFPQERCDNERNEPGVCMSMKTCQRKGGVASTRQCAQGYGICCNFEAVCQGEEMRRIDIRNNMTRLIHRRGNSMPSCSFSFPKPHNTIHEICQLRLEFRAFELGWSRDGRCLFDILRTTGARENFQLCGHIEQGSHLYLTYGDSDRINLEFDVRNITAEFDISVMMIKCNSIERAPDGCSMWYTQSKSEIRSFNYPYQQLNDQIYSVCIRMGDNANANSGLKWSKCGNTTFNQPQNEFFISGTTPGLPLTENDCQNDYILIPGSPKAKYCGGDFAGPLDPISTTTKPYMLFVHFDHEEIPLPIGPIGPNGCPNGWECIDSTTGLPSPPRNSCSILVDPNLQCKPMTFTPVGGVPVASPILAQTDLKNTGFCLKYTRM